MKPSSMPARRASAVASVLIVAAFLLSGCGPASNALQEAGFSQTSTSTDFTTHAESVGVSPIPGQSPEQMLTTVARIMWQKSEGRMDSLCVTLYVPASDNDSSGGRSRRSGHGGDNGYSRPADLICPMPGVPSMVKTRAELQAQFGPRPAGLDEAGTSVGTILLIVFGGIFLVILLIAGLIVYIVRRNRKARAQFRNYGYPRY